VRWLTLQALESVYPAAAARNEDLQRSVAWQGPRLGADREALVLRTMRESELLGITGRSALSPVGVALLAEDASGDRDLRVAGTPTDMSDAERMLARLLPSPVDHVMLQADLTAVAPGPLENRLARQFEQLAMIESRGGATVYRFSARTVRRALDAGWDRDSIHTFLADHSRTPVPQP